MINVRINKYLADSGICSRRKADEHILAGKVKINNNIAKLGDVVDPSSDKVFFNHKLIRANDLELEYWAVNKPKGYISTVSDEFDRPKVTDLVKTKARLYPVGRLDAISHGLMILTNDGDFAQKASHPSFEHYKVYQVEIRFKDKLDEIELKNKFLKGIVIYGKIMKAVALEIADVNNSRHRARLLITLGTGHNRQIRKMCDKIGLEVLDIYRTNIGKLSLSNLDLAPGKAIKIKSEDVL